MRFGWVVALVLVLGLGGCSSGGGGGGGHGQSSAPTTARVDGGADTTGPGATVAAGTDYCGLARLYFKAFERFGQPGTSLELRTYYRDASAAMDQAMGVAPAEIKPDLDVVADGLRTLVAGLEGIGYDFARVASLPPDLITRLMSRPFVESSTKVAIYSRDKCGIA